MWVTLGSFGGLDSLGGLYRYITGNRWALEEDEEGIDWGLGGFGGESKLDNSRDAVRS